MKEQDQYIISMLLGFVSKSLLYRVLRINKKISVGFIRWQVYNKQLTRVLARLSTIKEFTKISIWLEGVVVMSSRLYIYPSRLLNSNLVIRLNLKGIYDTNSMQIAINVTTVRGR